MKRMGRRHRPFFRICVMDSRKPRDGRAIEEVGHYDPMVQDKSNRVSLKLDRIDYWLSVGAQPSNNVATLIKKVKTDTFGHAAPPPPMTPPKEPEPPAASEDQAAAEGDTETPAAADETAGGDDRQQESGDES